MRPATQALKELHDVDCAKIHEVVSELKEPVVFRGLAAQWPLVQAAQSSAQEVSDYLRQFDGGRPVTAFIGEAKTQGKIFYNEDLTSTNFEPAQVGLGQVLDKLIEHLEDPEPPTIYVGSSSIDVCLPGLSEHNRLPDRGHRASVRIWIGNKTRVAAHYDALENLACVCAGKRRFTLFPPDQLANLYVGPMDLTPAGQQVSLVDFDNPDFDRHPRYAEALSHARSAILEPGDCIYVPSMWWHQVDGLEPFNILINHWWREVPEYMGPPGDALLMAILNIRDLPIEQRQAWKGIFDHYVFNADDQTVSHIPPASRGVLGELDEDLARRLRALLRNKLNR